MATKTKKTQKVSAKQRAAKVAAAQAREEAAAAKQAKADRWKKIGIVIVAVILILALSLPTIGLATCSTNAASAAEPAVELSE